LHKIWQWVDGASGERRADEVSAKLISRIATLEQHPMLGPPRREFDDTARALVVMRWVVVYSTHDDEVRIVRIFDAASDIFRRLTGQHS
jgi:plasmid stabilization system protein ParE